MSESTSPPEQAGGMHVGVIMLAVLGVAIMGEVSSVVSKDNGGVSTPEAVYKHFFGPEEPPKLPQLKDNEVLIQFCMNWSYKGYYQQISQLLQRSATSPLKVIPAEYPLPRKVQMLTNMISVGTMVLMGAVFLYDKILPESWRANKMGTFLAIWIGSSMLSSMLTKSNAFEIYKGTDLVWSTLKSDRLPNMSDLIKGFEKVGVEIIPPRT